MHNLSQADFRHNFFTLKTPQNMYPSWRKNRTESHFSKPNFDMQGPNCCKSYNVYGDPQIFNFLLVQKNIYSLSPLCTRSLTSAQAEIWFFNSSDSGCRTKGPMPNLGCLTVMIFLQRKRKLNNFPKELDRYLHNFLFTRIIERWEE
jgi:hypothetical protein